MSILIVESLHRTYHTPAAPVEVLKGLNFEVAQSSSCAIVGPSGCGKTTLLGICAGLDYPDQGRVLLSGVDLFALSEDERSRLRAREIGFVFQSFQLIPSLTALENVMVPAELTGVHDPEPKARAMLERVGLQHRLHHYPVQLSGGEQQRVAIARAFSNQPSILFADEPTGNLDHRTGQTIVDLLFGLNHEQGTALVIVTHDRDLAAKTQQVIELRDGEIATPDQIPIGAT